MRVRASAISRTSFPEGVSLNGDDLARMLAAINFGFSPNEFGNVWYVHGNNGIDTNDGLSSTAPFLTMAKAFTMIGPGDTIYVAGNINEQLTTPTGAPDVTIIGSNPNPRHADTHPLSGEDSSTTWKIGSLGNNPLLILRNPGWKIYNILFAAHASNYALRLERTGVEDATEQDASHLEVLGCRFASGAGGISDTGGCFNVRVEGNIFQALTSFCILGVGNIGAGQGQWTVRNNMFLGFTNGVKCAFYLSRIEGNCFTAGGTPNTTVVLNTVNGIQGNNFVIGNFFQTATANFNTPDVVGNATDVWATNVSIDSTAAGVGGSFEWGQPA